MDVDQKGQDKEEKDDDDGSPGVAEEVQRFKADLWALASSCFAREPCDRPTAAQLSEGCKALAARWQRWHRRNPLWALRLTLPAAPPPPRAKGVGGRGKQSKERSDKDEDGNEENDEDEELLMGLVGLKRVPAAPMAQSEHCASAVKPGAAP